MHEMGNNRLPTVSWLYPGGEMKRENVSAGIPRQRPQPLYCTYNISKYYGNKWDVGLLLPAWTTILSLV